MFSTVHMQKCEYKHCVCLASVAYSFYSYELISNLSLFFPSRLRSFPAVCLKYTLIVRAVFINACHSVFPRLLGHHCKMSHLVTSVWYYYVTWLMISHQPNETENRMDYWALQPTVWNKQISVQPLPVQRNQTPASVLWVVGRFSSRSCE